jgi:hypothetical protein
MRKKFLTLVIVTLFLTAACSAGPATQASAPQNPANPPVTETSVPATPEVIQSVPEVSTTIPLNALPTLATETLVPGGNTIPESGITLEDKGKTFKLKVGDSFLLNLGTDVYDWAVTVDNENVLHLKMGVMVIRGAQGIYDAVAPGTATISATGNPLCLQSNPPCAAPSILFTIKLIVE